MNGGKGAETRHKDACIRAFRLSKIGYTNRQIAERIGVDVKRIPKLREIGERHLSLNEEAK